MERAVGEYNVLEGRERILGYYGQANGILDRTNSTLSLSLNDSEFRQPVVKAFENLQNMTWKAAEDLEGIRSHT